MKRKLILTALALVAFAAQAQEFPSRPVRIVVPWLPGEAVREPLFVSNAARLYRFGVKN